MESNIHAAGEQEPAGEMSPTPADSLANGVIDAAPVAHAETSLPMASVPEDHAPAAAADIDDAATTDSANAVEGAAPADPSDPQVKKGAILKGVIAQTTPTEIMIDLGLKAPAIVPSKEIERMDKETIDALKVGEEVDVFVLNPENRDGYVVVSIARAAEERDWRMAEEHRQNTNVYEGKIDGYNKGGLIVRFGRLRGFVPESQASRDRRMRAAGTDPQEKWGSMRGEDISVKVLEVDRQRNRLILSERDATPQLREQKKEKLLDELQVGDVKVGRVKSVADFGAFVDVGGADGLVHLTEISWKHINHPKDVLKVGQEVEVEVINVDRERKRIGLSIKRREEDPWKVITRKYQEGELVQGTITKLTKFGAFARLVDNPEIEGLIHISELSTQRVTHPKEVVNEGDVLTLRVVKIDSDERRLGLSLKRANSTAYIEADIKRAMSPAREANPGADIADFEAQQLKEGERRRDRKKGGGGSSGGGGKRGGKKGKGDFSDDYGDDYR
ncbi:MAG TPA: S1 RNA-binding domain-containing protein [Aggregatilineales bacterium]|nr:S1 RNA-binding domain-containing protein [Anaerolineales bacterium]HRE47531.1 S1 RNA-binding domain-containing protein [Aggregatilineales bacterium]